MTFLLDVNVLIALLDPTHIHHDAAHEWFGIEGQESWATCPLTENGVLRIVGHPTYRNFPGNPKVISESLAELRMLQGHTFWPDDISLLDSSRIDLTRLLTAAQVTDSYLLGLAQAHGGRLATLDKRLVTDAVRHGARSLRLIR